MTNKDFEGFEEFNQFGPSNDDIVNPYEFDKPIAAGASRVKAIAVASAGFVIFGALVSGGAFAMTGSLPSVLPSAPSVVSVDPSATPTDTTVATDPASATPTDTATPTETATATPTDTAIATPSDTATATPTDTGVPVVTPSMPSFTGDDEGDDQSDDNSDDQGFSDEGSDD